MFIRIINDLPTLNDAEVDGVDELARTLSTDTANFRNLAYEAKVASKLEDNGYDVARLGRNVKTSDGPTEIDIQLESGSTIEVKHGEFKLNEKSKKQLKRQLQYRKENGISGNHYVKVKGEITEEMKTWLKKNNVRVLDGNTPSSLSTTKSISNPLIPTSKLIGRIAF